MAKGKESAPEGLFRFREVDSVEFKRVHRNRGESLKARELRKRREGAGWEERKLEAEKRWRLPIHCE